MFSKKSRTAKRPAQKVIASLRLTGVDSSITSLIGWSQIRRCHRCGETHAESGERVPKCGSCGANFAPYFFAELTPDSLSQVALEFKPQSMVLSEVKHYRPVIGITWWWNESEQNSGETIMPRA